MFSLRRRKPVSDNDQRTDDDDDDRSERPETETEAGKRSPWWWSVLKWGLFAILLPPVSNYGSLQTERRQLLPDNVTLFDIGFGQKLHMVCEGSGEPTVVLDAPAGETSDAWGSFRAELVALTRVCAYDRAGLGFSDPEPRFNRSDPIENAVAGAAPFTTDKMVVDLHRLTDHLPPQQQQAPLMLVGSELGALNVLAFARRFPERVGQVVLINPIHPSLLSGEGRSWLEERVAVAKLLQLTAAAGLNRIGILLGFMEAAANPRGSRSWVRSRHLMTDPFHLGSAAMELENLPASLDQAKDAFAAAIKAPAAVITGDRYDELLPAEVNRAWAGAAESVASDLPGCRRYVIDGANGKAIYHQSKEAADIVKELLRKQR